MNPDKKYMQNSKKKDNDLNLVPFNIQQNSKNDATPIIGWVPIFIFNNDTQKAVPANAMIVPSNISNLDFFNPSEFGNSLNLSPWNNNMGLNMKPWDSSKSYITPPDSINTNYDKNVKNATSSPNVFPNDYSSDDLFNYHNQTYNSSNNRLDEKVTEILKNIDLNLDEDSDLIRHCTDKRINKIYEIIEKNHPEICALMDNYNVPSPISKLILRRTIKVTLEHCKG